MAWSPHPIIRCFGLYRPHLRLFIITTIVAMGVNLSLPLTQYIIGLAIHDLEQGIAVVRLPDGSLDLSQAWMWVGLLLGFTFFRGVAQYGGAVLSVVLGQRLLHDLRAGLLAKVQHLDQAYHLVHGTGEIVTRTTRDSDKVRDAVVGGWRTLLETALVIIGCLGMLAYYHLLLAVVPLVLVIIGVWWFIAQARHLVTLDRAAGDAYDIVTQELAEGVGGVRVIKSFALEDVRVAGFARAVIGYTGPARRALRYAVLQLPLPQMFVALGHVWILWYGTVLVANHTINIGELVAALMIINAIVFRVENVGRTMQTFAEASASAERIMQIFDAQPAIFSASGQLPDGQLGVHFNAIQVRSPTGASVLNNLSLKIAPGSVVALVGPTGCGKSTLASLLPRLIDPQSGSLTFGNDQSSWVDARALDLTNLRQRVQVVYQDSFLFSDTVRNNLLLGQPSASDADIDAALTAAHAHDIIQSLPNGLQTIIGERGATLSGGQRQRLCLARALIARPAVLCLDDATSALDAVTERHILDHLRQHNGGTTVLVIASKLSTILLADRVIMLDEGHIAADGTHAALLAQSATYRELLGGVA
jgi:ABC-type multidrug transport system fused ATPase/permease subunit